MNWLIFISQFYKFDKIRILSFRIFFLFAIFISCKENKKSHFYNNENYDYKEAWSFLDKKNNDSAFKYFNKSKIEFAKSKEPLGIAKSLMNMASIQREYSDYFGSQENAVEALKILEKINDTIYISSNYNILGTNQLDLKNYAKSLEYFQKAIDNANNQTERSTSLNNKAIVFQKIKNYDSSIIILKNLIQIAPKNGQYIDNLAYTKFLQNKNYNAEPELFKALKIREKEKDLWGQNASHAHLADYFAEKNLEKGLFHAHKMYEVAKSLKSPDDEIEALQKLINLETSENSKVYFNIYKNLNDSIQTARNKAKNQFALIRYDAEKNRADFLKSEAENAQKQNHILKQNIALGLSFLAITIGIIWYKKRRKRLEQEKELEIKNTQLKYSKKVHDVVANGVYQLMTEVENTESIDKNHLLDQLENIYEKSRDISYEDAYKKAGENFANKISQLINSYTSPKIQIFIVGNDEHFWEKVSQKLQSELYMVIQELMINMKKHSFAKRVSVKFEKNTDNLTVSYFDDGIGLSKESLLKKHGLQNTENRIFSCGGIIIFDENIEKGTKIKIEIPLEKI